MSAGPEAAVLRGRRSRVASPWPGFVVRRLAGVACVLASLVVVTFLMVHLIPGDPARNIAGINATPEQVTYIQQQLRLDEPLPAQFADYVGALAGGSFGESFETGEPVADVLGARLALTAELALLAVLVVLFAGVGLGLLVAVACRSGRGWLDTAFTVATSIGGSVPEYVAGTLLVFVFAVTLGLFPAAGADTASGLVLPVIAISIGPTATLARIARREVATVLEQDYMRTARGKRISARRLYLRHALPNILTSTLTYGGLLLAGLLGGTVVVENIFGLPGIGSRLVEAVELRDYPVIQGTVLLLGAMACTVTLLVDVALAAIDPRSLSGDRP
ncbi:ABC transporter permease [Conexibacter woesei]|uniref:Binding-protein-dependent transport systems inner membrane component n=1 Tax=Conexibacter woesei (strain DSM 14684 / CCUG 47730 / CIP 108061 / JCM 11494 / NBRC 100937 / ID131577) TaxID=469383 RepID=D3F6G6_CONWI|nr:ABC transporter permease [Conexibacter woesei]ADB50733.1 binding-protein-dependent transport systems inner membrane component [Conexibacter woesei DSM 14684]